MVESKTSRNEPADWFKGLKQNWRNDFIASIGVAFVALPLALGVSYASSAPLMAGLISAIIAGLFTTFVRGSHIGVNGAAAGLAVVCAGTIYSLSENGNIITGFNYALAVFIVAGALQVVFGLLKFGKYSDSFPSSVIQGMLAAIGIIIAGKQFHVGLGVKVGNEDDKLSPLQEVLEIGDSIWESFPYPTIIAVISLLILILHPRVNNKIIKFIPAGMWVLMFTIPLVYLYQYYHETHFADLDDIFYAGEIFLINLPGDITEHVMLFRPDFGKIGTAVFWLWVFTIMLISSIITMLSAKAVDKLDPYRRRSDMNRELIGVGLSTMLAGFLGGLPIVTVIVRSSVNVNNGAKTRWSSFFHGVILFVLVILLTPLIQKIPLAALAAILVYTGYKLAAPKMFIDTYRKGAEQFIILCATLFLCLLWGVLLGVILGIVITLALQYSKMNISINLFRKYITKPNITVNKEDNGVHHVKVKGISNFFNILGLMKRVNSLPAKENIIVDFSQTRLIDYTVLEYIHQKADTYNLDGGQFDIVGLEVHQPSSDHPYSLHVLETEKVGRLTKRQQELKQVAASNGWTFSPKINWNIIELKGFKYFQSKPIEYKKNVITGSFEELDTTWEICDITFDEGALVAKEVYHTTIQIARLPYRIPRFTLEKEEFFDRIIDIANPEDIDFKKFKQFSDKFLLKGKDEEAIKEFFTPEITNYLNKKEVYHLESRGNALLIFKYKRYAGPRDVIDMNIFTENLIREIDIHMKLLKEQ